MYEEERLRELYAELIWDEGAVAEGLAGGQLVRDERVAEFLPQCPDPLAGGPAGSVRVELAGPELERERGEIELDAMRLMTRTQRFTMLQLDHARERIDQLHAKNDHLRLKLSRTLGRRLLKRVRRLRASLPRGGGPPEETGEEAQLGPEAAEAPGVEPHGLRG
jgi:hypothetical protein